MRAARLSPFEARLLLDDTTNRLLGRPEIQTDIGKYIAGYVETLFDAVNIYGLREERRRYWGLWPRPVTLVMGDVVHLARCSMYATYGDPHAARGAKYYPADFTVAQAAYAAIGLVEIETAEAFADPYQPPAAPQT